MSKDLPAAFGTIGSLVARARDAVRAGDPGSLEALETRVAELCAELSARPELMRQNRAPLIALIDELSQLEQQIRTAMRDASAGLQDTAVRRRAVSAYETAPTPPKSR